MNTSAFTLLTGFSAVCSLLCLSGIARGEDNDLVEYREVCSPPSHDSDPRYDMGHPLPPSATSIQLNGYYITLDKNKPLERFCKFESIATENIGAQNDTATEICQTKWQEREISDQKAQRRDATLVCPDHKPVAKGPLPMPFMTKGPKLVTATIRGTHDEEHDARVVHCYALCSDVLVQNFSLNSRLLRAETTMLSDKNDAVEKQLQALQERTRQLEKQVQGQSQ